MAGQPKSKLAPARHSASSIMGRSSDSSRSTVRNKVCTWEAHRRTCASFNGALPTLSAANALVGLFWGEYRDLLLAMWGSFGIPEQGRPLAGKE